MFTRARRYREYVATLREATEGLASQIATLTEASEKQASGIVELTHPLTTMQQLLDSPPWRPKKQKGRFARWIASWRPSKQTAAEIAAENEAWWFDDYLPSVRPSWEKRIANYLRLHPEASREEAEKEATDYVLNQAQTEYDKLDSELEKGLARSNVITGSAALVAALILGLVTIVVTQKISFNVPVLMGAASLMAICFVLNMWSMRPPLKRALSEPYVDMAEWSVLVVDTFTQWAMLTYGCRSRQRIVTKYKQLHAISITVFTVGVMWLGPAFAWASIERLVSSLF